MKEQLSLDASSPKAFDDAANRQQLHGVSFIRYQWLDLLGILRTRVLSKSYASKMLHDSKFLSVGPAALYCSYVDEPDTTPRSAASTIRPDWRSLLPCTYYPHASHASVMCYVHEGVDNMQMKRDPRSVLDEVVQRAQSLHGIEYLVGFELEFVVLQKSKDDSKQWEILDNVAGWSTAAALHGEITPILEKICHQLQNAGNGITVCQFHTESSQGMFEIVTGPLPPREAVDALVFAMEAIKATFLTHGYKATFFPKSGGGHTGQHLHLSIQNPKPHHETQFLAGLLAHLPAVYFAGATGTWVSWGTELRDVPIRKIDATHWEIRCADGTANMYLGLAAVLHAGQLGLENSLELTVQDATEAPGTNKVTRLQRNITQRLPRSLIEAVNELYEDEALKKALGEELCAKYLRHKILEAEIQGKLSEEERRATCIQFW
ncbi:Protein fluG [Exophiala dermatitidis]